jgi:general secretion pathway protein G
MKTNLRKTHKGKAGFTLIEIMAVVLIIGLLIAAVGGPITKALFGGQQTTIKMNISNLEASIKLYKMNNFRYPESWEDLLNGDFIEGGRVPSDPWGVDYFYEPPTDGDNYVVGTYGRDGVAGGEGEDADITNETVRERK